MSPISLRWSLTTPGLGAPCRVGSGHVGGAGLQGDGPPAITPDQAARLLELCDGLMQAPREIHYGAEIALRELAGEHQVDGAGDEDLAVFWPRLREVLASRSMKA